jgi:hypothetical protein
VKYLEKFIVPYELIEETSETLRDYGRKGCEGLVLWLGHFDDDDTCRVERILVPPQDSIKSEDGVGYFVTAETLFALNKMLSDTGLRLLAQVHSHPTWAYHSATDDSYCIVTMEGGFSIVVPDFGFGPSDIVKWATFRLVDGRWKELAKKEIKSIFRVEGEPDKSKSKNGGLLSEIKKIFH